ncbi:MAG: ABC transporter ATP-binding protein [Candidatus Heimdallarchaeota archaeon]|nr:ABC transporter ATP-binding protein [Candidatus Heimdallarchaeota archaeon]MCK4289618.1 ABC transporter ATP-binding protein [Candidatus Heimdallarchaeota archaeon]
MSNLKEALDPVIRIENLTKNYNLGELSICALDNVSFSVDSGEMVFIMGPSGSGKTTLINLIGGIDHPTNGTIEIIGEDIAQYTDKELTLYRKKRLAFVFQFYSLIPTLTARENVELTLELTLRKRRNISKIAEEHLTLVGLEDRMDNFPFQLSGGERQRVAIARALAKSPDILLVDEPTGQLDQKTGDNVVSLIRKIAKEKKKTVLLVTHDHELECYADRVIRLRSGQIVADDTNSLLSSTDEGILSNVANI